MPIIRWAFFKEQHVFRPKQFALAQLDTDDLPEVLQIEQVLDLIAAAHAAASDQRSDLDESRISHLRKALADIEGTTKDPLSALAAKRALSSDED